MAFARLAAVGRDTVYAIMAGIHSGAELPERGLLASALLALEDDDRAAAVDNLRRLGARKAVLQRRQSCGIVSGERRPPFKVRKVDRHPRGLSHHDSARNPINFD